MTAIAVEAGKDARRTALILAASQAIIDLFAGRVPVIGEIEPPVTMEQHFVRLFADYDRVRKLLPAAA